jgi:hypothetical protein
VRRLILVSIFSLTSRIPAQSSPYFSHYSTATLPLRNPTKAHLCSTSFQEEKETKQKLFPTSFVSADSNQFKLNFLIGFGAARRIPKKPNLIGDQTLKDYESSLGSHFELGAQLLWKLKGLNLGLLLTTYRTKTSENWEIEGTTSFPPRTYTIDTEFSNYYLFGFKTGVEFGKDFGKLYVSLIPSIDLIFLSNYHIKQYNGLINQPKNSFGRSEFPGPIGYGIRLSAEYIFESRIYPSFFSGFTSIGNSNFQILDFGLFLKIK